MALGSLGGLPLPLREPEVVVSFSATGESWREPEVVFSSSATGEGLVLDVFLDLAMFEAENGKMMIVWMPVLN